MSDNVKSLVKSNKYNDLLKIVDQLRLEAPKAYKRYHPKDDQIEVLNNARARAFIHLFLKVKFGFTEFNERENYITDDAYDGGIDAYYIDEENKKLYFIQSKFRNTDFNFENKDISVEELLSMDIDRIIGGEIKDDKGNQYNDKIVSFQKKLQSISDLPRYKYEIILLANVKDSLKPKLNKLTGGYVVDIYNFERVYRELVFPLVSGSFFQIKELKITINCDRNSAGHRIQYYPITRYAECTVNALFVPTEEIARILHKYKNSILRFNPRSYLDLVSGSVNEKISKTITELNTNEFALFNNGITMLSDDTVYSDKVGKKNKAEILITNPQIINGGQTAYTLSILYEKLLKEGGLNFFENKEVLLKIISFNSDDSNEEKFQINKLKLIEEISVATNQQSAVLEADRRANDRVQVELQEKIYQDFGLFYERKRGEFGDGIKNNYIDREKIINRELFLRVCLACRNNPKSARSGNINNFFMKDAFDEILPDSDNYRKYIYALKAFNYIPKVAPKNSNSKDLARYAITSVTVAKFDENLQPEEFDEAVMDKVREIVDEWKHFEDHVRLDEDNKKYYFNEIFDKETGDKMIETDWAGYYKGRTLHRDLKNYFKID